MGSPNVHCSTTCGVYDSIPFCCISRLDTKTFPLGETLVTMPVRETIRNDTQLEIKTTANSGVVPSMSGANASTNGVLNAMIS